MKFKILVLLMFTASFMSCKKKDGDGVCYTNSNAQSIIHDGVEREYVIYIPNSYDGNTAVPILLNFHGFGGSASEFMTYADMRFLAESDTFILVYPQGSCSNGSSHWNPCPTGGDNKSNADDFGFVEAMLNQITSQYNVDTERIYAAGYSNGGMMAFGLANYKSELIAAVASVSGTMLDCMGSVSHPMPIIQLHGTSDGVIPYNGSGDYNSVQFVLDHWVDFNNTIASPIMNSDNSGGMTIEHYTYDQGDSNVSVEHYKYIGGDHVWFMETYQNQNASSLIWNFVSKFDVNGLK